MENNYANEQVDLKASIGWREILTRFPIVFYHQILLVGGFSPAIPSPLEKYEFVSWDDDSQDIEK